VSSTASFSDETARGITDSLKTFAAWSVSLVIVPFMGAMCAFQGATILMNTVGMSPDENRPSYFNAVGFLYTALMTLGTILTVIVPLAIVATVVILIYTTPVQIRLPLPWRKRDKNAKVQMPEYDTPVEKTKEDKPVKVVDLSDGPEVSPSDVDFSTAVSKRPAPGDHQAPRNPSNKPKKRRKK